MKQHERLEWVKEELSEEIAELREVAEAEAEAAERTKARRRFRWGSMATVIAVVVALLLFLPVSPVRVFSASTVVEQVRVVATVPVQDKCGFQTQAQGAIMATCVESVEKLSDKTLRFNVKWHANITSGGVTAVGRGKSEAGDTLPYLQDESGNVYNFTEVGGSASAPFFLRHGESEIGSFLFPALADGETTVSFVDEDVNTGQQTRLENIVLE